MIHSHYGYVGLNKKGYCRTWINFIDLYRIHEIETTKAGYGYTLRDKLNLNSTIRAGKEKSKTTKVYKFNGRDFKATSRIRPLLGYTYDQDYRIYSIDGILVKDHPLVKNYFKMIKRVSELEKEITSILLKNGYNQDISLIQRIGDKILTYSSKYRKFILEDNLIFKFNKLDKNKFSFSLNGDDFLMNLGKDSFPKI